MPTQIASVVPNRTRRVSSRAAAGGSEFRSIYRNYPSPTQKTVRDGLPLSNIGNASETSLE
jgi:hypothetical protein